VGARLVAKVVACQNFHKEAAIHKKHIARAPISIGYDYEMLHDRHLAAVEVKVS